MIRERSSLVLPSKMAAVQQVDAGANAEGLQMRNVITQLLKDFSANSRMTVAEFVQSVAGGTWPTEYK